MLDSDGAGAIDSSKLTDVGAGAEIQSVVSTTEVSLQSEAWVSRALVHEDCMQEGFL